MGLLIGLLSVRVFLLVSVFLMKHRALRMGSLPELLQVHPFCGGVRLLPTVLMYSLSHRQNNLGCGNEANPKVLWKGRAE